MHKINENILDNKDFNSEINSEINDCLIDNSFISFIKSISEINTLFYKELLNIKSISLSLKYTKKIINFYFNEINNERKDKKKILMKKTNIKNHIYFIKYLKEKKINRKYKILKEKIVSNFSISFIFNIFAFLLTFKNQKKSDSTNKKIAKLNYLLIITFIYIEKLYIEKIINDDYFELILLLLIAFSCSKTIDKIPKEKEIVNIIFFKGCINLIKIVSNKLILLNHEFTNRQEQMLNNIILFINNNFLDTFEKLFGIKYINKVFLSKNDYNTSSLIDLSSIISKTKLKDIKKNFIDLLTNVYIFSFEYNSLMSPMIKQLEPLFINIHKKNINQIENELDFHDFSLILLDSLINKEKEILKNNFFILKQGFYLGNEKSGIIYDLSILDNEFDILVGFKLDSIDLYNVSLLQLVDKTKNISQLKIFFIKTTNEKDHHEMFIQYMEDTEWSTKISIYCNTTYIFIFNINNEDSFK